MSWAMALILGFIGLFLAMLLWSGLSAQNLRGQPVNALYELFPDLEKHRARAVIYCFSAHCGPCRKMDPNLFKLDVSRHSAPARALGIRATPTTLLVEDGKVLKVLLGANTLGAVEVFLHNGGS
jgi:thioredoxin 1